MNTKILICCLAAVPICLAGCATHPGNTGSTPALTAPTAAPISAVEILGKNLRQAYPPLDSYFITPVGLGTVKVFLSIDGSGYGCRVYSLANGKTHVGQVDHSAGLPPPTLTEVKFAKDHDIKVLFIDVSKIQSSPSPLSAGASQDLPTFTDIALINKWGGTLDTITVSTAVTNKVSSALLALCSKAR